MTLSGLQPWLRPYADYLVTAMQRYGRVTVTSTYRSYSEQLALYRNRAINPYPVAPPGCSQHNLGLAWDMTTDVPGLLEAAGRAWKAAGGDWRASDPIHFGVGGQPC